MRKSLIKRAHERKITKHFATHCTQQATGTDYLTLQQGSLELSKKRWVSHAAGVTSRYPFCVKACVTQAAKWRIVCGGPLCAAAVLLLQLQKCATQKQALYSLSPPLSFGTDILQGFGHFANGKLGYVVDL